MAGLALAAVLLVLVAKPWAADAPATADRATAASAADRATAASAGPAQPPAAGVASPVPAASDQCEFALGWRVFVTEASDPIGDWSGDRRWLAIDPAVSADSPDDASIPFVLVTEPALALGYCAPSEAGGGPPAGTGMTAWAVAPGGDPERLRLVDLSSDQVGAGRTEGLFAPQGNATPGSDTPGSPPARDAAAPGWPEGRYVLRLSAGSGYARWFGVELRYPAASSGSLAPLSRPAEPGEPVPTIGSAGVLPSGAAMSGGLLRG